MAFAQSIPALALTIVIWTFGEMFFFPASAAYATDVAPDSRRGEYSGLYTMTFSIAFALGPWAGTAVLEHSGARVLWTLTFVLGLVAAALFLRMPEPLHHKEAEVEIEPEVPGAAAIAPPPEPS